MSRVEALLRFLWDFVVGDDWRIAVAVVFALALTAIVAGAGLRRGGSCRYRRGDAVAVSVSSRAVGRQEGLP